MSDSEETFDVMAPVELDDGTTVWMKCGLAFSSPSKRHAMKIVLMALPARPNKGAAYEFLFFEREDDDE